MELMQPAIGNDHWAVKGLRQDGPRESAYQMDDRFTLPAAFLCLGGLQSEMLTQRWVACMAKAELVAHMGERCIEKLMNGGY